MFSSGTSKSNTWYIGCLFFLWIIKGLGEGRPRDDSPPWALLWEPWEPPIGKKASHEGQELQVHSTNRWTTLLDGLSVLLLTDTNDFLSMSSLYSDGSIGVLLSNKIYFENFDLKLVKYIYKKKKIINFILN